MKALILVVLATLTALAACTPNANRAPEPVVMRSYDVPQALAQELRSVLSSAFFQGDNQPRLGSVVVTPGGRLLVSAPEGVQRGVADLLDKVKKAPPAPPPSVEMDYWIVLGRRGEKTEGKTIAPEIADVLDALQEREAPMQLALLDHLSVRSLSGESGEITGRNVSVRQRATAHDAAVMAQVDMHYLSGAGKMSTMMELSKGEPVVFAQAGIELVEGQPFFSPDNRQATAFYIVRAKAAK